MIRIAAGLLLLAIAAQAQERPVWPPTRDATVTYATSGQGRPEGAPSEIKMSFAAAQGKMRMDVGEMYMLTDYRAKTMQMVMPSQRVVMTMPMSGAQQQQMFDPSMIEKAVRKGTDSVAGTSCTVWDISAQGHPGEVCITGDGIMLRATSAQGGKMEATKVVYGPVPDSQLTAPRDYEKMQMPAGAGRPGQRP